MRMCDRKVSLPLHRRTASGNGMDEDGNACMRNLVTQVVTGKSRGLPRRDCCNRLAIRMSIMTRTHTKPCCMSAVSRSRIVKK